MTDRRPIQLALIGNRRFPRYAITLFSYSFLPLRYWTGGADDPWSTDPSEALLWADYGTAELAWREVEAAESDDQAGAR